MIEKSLLEFRHAVEEAAEQPLIEAQINFTSTGQHFRFKDGGVSTFGISKNAVYIGSWLEMYESRSLIARKFYFTNELKRGLQFAWLQQFNHAVLSVRHSITDEVKINEAVEKKLLALKRVIESEYNHVLLEINLDFHQIYQDFIFKNGDSLFRMTPENIYAGQWVVNVYNNSRRYYFLEELKRVEWLTWLKASEAEDLKRVKASLSAEQAKKFEEWHNELEAKLSRYDRRAL